jgi:hypothetical protein
MFISYYIASTFTPWINELHRHQSVCQLFLKNSPTGKFAGIYLPSFVDEGVCRVERTLLLSGKGKVL